jgi:hypothetical protein
MPSALVGMTGAMNNLTTTICETSMQSDREIFGHSVEIISKLPYLTPLQKAKLSLHYSKNPMEASALGKMDPEFLKASLELILDAL